MTRIRLPLASLACAVLLLAGCRRDPARAVLGEWTSGPGKMLFYPDGQVLMEQADSTASVARWEFVDKHKRRLRIRSLAASPAEYGLAVTRDSLVLCADGAPAQCFRLSRVPGGR